MAKIYRYLGFGILLVLLLCLQYVNAQEDVQLRLVAVDTSAFPTVRITLLTRDSRSAPVDLADLSLRENGVPISDLTFTHVPNGVDVIFVLDANGGFGEIDGETGLTRREKALDSVRRFTEQYMNDNGLDTVSIVVPDEEGQGGQFLIREVATSQEVEEVIDAYDPQRLGPTPLNAMMVLALDEAQQRNDNGRFQAILLMSDGRRLDQQLSFPLLVAQANDANVPIYSAILGESADDHEIGNVSRLSDPSQAFYIHMSEPAAADPIYKIWQDQSNPVQVEYRSRQRQSGRNQLTLNLGPALASTSFELMLASPEITLSLTDSEILRAGTAPDTPLGALQPTVHPVTISVEWPDGLLRQISDVTLIVDGQPEQFSSEWQDDGQGHILLDWNISDLEEGKIELAAEVIDELGYKGSSEPVAVNIVVERPLAPTPVPTTETQEVVSQNPQINWMNWDLLVAAVLFLILIVIILLWRRRKRGAKDALAADDRETNIELEDRESDDIVLIASLESFEDGDEEIYALEGDNVAIGSEARRVQIFLNDGSVNRLHARIRKQEQEYWLFDEGSFEGTYLNYERLTLAPQRLSDGDVVQFGKVKFRFCLRQIIK